MRRPLAATTGSKPEEGADGAEKASGTSDHHDAKGPIRPPRKGLNGALLVGAHPGEIGYRQLGNSTYLRFGGNEVVL